MLEKKNPAVAGFLVQQTCECLLCGCDIAGLQTFRALLDIKVHGLAFCQGLEAITCDCREVYEYIFATISRGDETKTFGLVEPSVPVAM